METHVELKELWRSFGPVTALQGINLSLGTVIVSLLGPSGCGKTTALRLVAGFSQPDGQIIVYGKDITNRPPNKRDMGMNFEASACSPKHRRAERRLRVEICGKAKADRLKRVDELLELVGLGHEEALPAPALGGMQQRVALARALAIEPSVLSSSALARRRRCACSSGGDPADPARARDHHDLRHAGPGGGALDLRPGRGDVRGQDRAGRVPREDDQCSATPFVAEFIGTMNRLASTVAGDGMVEYGGKQLHVHAADGAGARCSC